jgi:hypothetical protein
LATLLSWEFFANVGKLYKRIKGIPLLFNQYKNPPLSRQMNEENICFVTIDKKRTILLKIKK